MREEQSLVSLKRQQFRVQLRKKQLNNYFQKRRVQMLADKYIQNSSHLQDQQRCNVIITLINQFSSQKLYKLLSKIIEIDITLSIFYRLTGFNAESPPAFFKEILQKILGLQIGKQMMYQQFSMTKPFSKDEKQQLLLLWKEMQYIWKKQSQNYINIIFLLKRVQDINLLIRREIIQFLSIIVNILVVFRKLASMLGMEVTQRTLIGQVKFMNYQIQSTSKILINILSGNDELLIPFLNDILQSNGCSPQFLGLYYNMLLVQNVPFGLKLKMVHFLTRLLQNQRDWFLEDHKVIIDTLSIGLKVMVQPSTQSQKQNMRYVGERIINLLSGLLNVINMRFDTFNTSFDDQNQSDNLFLNGLTYIIYKFSHNQLIRNIMQQKSITLFMVNHLTYTKIGSELKVIEYCIHILINATKDHHSIHFFLNQEPRLLLRVLALFQKYLKLKYQKMSSQQTLVLKATLVLIRDLSLISKVAQKFIEQKILNKICFLYFKIQASSQNGRFMREKMQYIYLILVKYLKGACIDLQHFYQFLLSQKEICFMMINMLKYTPQRRFILVQTFDLLTYILISCGEVSTFQTVREIFQQSAIISQLNQIQNCDNIKISEKASQMLQLIKRLKYMKGPNYDDYQQQDL